jgi:hypothetical protein
MWRVRRHNQREVRFIGLWDRVTNLEEERLVIMERVNGVPINLANICTIIFATPVAYLGACGPGGDFLDEGPGASHTGRQGDVKGRRVTPDGKHDYDQRLNWVIEREKSTISLDRSVGVFNGEGAT